MPDQLKILPQWRAGGPTVTVTTIAGGHRHAYAFDDYAAFRAAVLSDARAGVLPAASVDGLLMQGWLRACGQ